MFFADESDLVQILRDLFVFLTVVFTGVMAWKMANLKASQDAVAKKVDTAAVQVKKVAKEAEAALAENTAATTETLETTKAVHALLTGEGTAKDTEP